MADDHLDIERNYIEGSNKPVRPSRWLDNQYGQSTQGRSSSNTRQSYSSDGEKRKLEIDKDENLTTTGDEQLADVDNVKKQKITIGFSKTFNSVRSASEKKNPLPISIKLGAQKPKETTPNLKKASTSVANIFNQDSDEEEEMPPEAKMRMRNIGRDTPTSAGPNSFGKTRQGFCDVKKVFERQLKKQIEEPHHQ